MYIGECMGDINKKLFLYKKKCIRNKKKTNIFLPRFSNLGTSWRPSCKNEPAGLWGEPPLPRPATRSPPNWPASFPRGGNRERRQNWSTKHQQQPQPRKGQGGREAGRRRHRGPLSPAPALWLPSRLGKGEESQPATPPWRAGAPPALRRALGHAGGAQDPLGRRSGGKGAARRTLPACGSVPAAEDAWLGAAEAELR